jgi:hypothetical protein
MNKAKIISELNMVVARLFGRQSWLADRETYSAVKRKLIQMGLVEQIFVETSRITALGRELDVDLFQVFMGVMHEWDVPITLEEDGLLNESEFDAITESSKVDAETLLSGMRKRAYFVYRKANKFLH